MFMLHIAGSLEQTHPNQYSPNLLGLLHGWTGVLSISPPRLSRRKFLPIKPLALPTCYSSRTILPYNRLCSSHCTVESIRGPLSPGLTACLHLSRRSAPSFHGMAPTQPSSHRTARPARSILKTASVQPRLSVPKSEALFAASKKDKRRIKHAQLVSKITKSTTASRRRRRPSKKFLTTLDALADALPQAETTFDEEHVDQTTPDRQVNIIKRKSVKSRPGALKRRETLDNAERQRFAKNMAQLSGSRAAETASNTPHESAVQVSDPGDRWTALRGFIAETLEKEDLSCMTSHRYCPRSSDARYTVKPITAVPARLRAHCVLQLISPEMHRLLIFGAASREHMAHSIVYRHVLSLCLRPSTPLIIT